MTAADEARGRHRERVDEGRIAEGREEVAAVVHARSEWLEEGVERDRVCRAIVTTDPPTTSSQKPSSRSLVFRYRQTPATTIAATRRRPAARGAVFVVPEARTSRRSSTTASRAYCGRSSSRLPIPPTVFSVVRRRVHERDTDDRRVKRPPAERLAARGMQEVESADEEQRDPRHLVREHAQRVERSRADESDRRPPALAAHTYERDVGSEEREDERDGVQAGGRPQADRVRPREDESEARDGTGMYSGHRYRPEEEVAAEAGHDAEHEREQVVSPEMVAEERMG